MKQRVITGLILAAIFLPLIFAPNLIFTIAMAVLAMIAIFEFFMMVQKKEPFPVGYFVYPLVFTLLLFVVIRLMFHDASYAPWLLVILSIELFVGVLFLVFRRKFSFETLAKMIFGTLYIALPFAALARIHNMGLPVLFYLLMLAMLTDIFAYFFGVTFGKHKLAPDISPKKTVEGALGGTFAAVVIASVFAYWQSIFDIDPVWLHLTLMVVIGIFISFVAQVGDLVASALKRNHEIKDFSRLFPGHGGVIDRFDSTMFAALFLSVVMMIMEFFQ